MPQTLVTLDEEDTKKIEELMSLNGKKIAKSDFIRRIIIDYLNTHGNNKGTVSNSKTA